MSTAPSIVRKSLGQWHDFHLDLVHKGVDWTTGNARELTRAVGMNFFLFNRFVEGGMIPTVRSLTSINQDIAGSLLETVKGDKPLPSHLHEMKGRFRSGIRYEQLINTLGRDLFGSARFDGEQLLAENDFYKLSYLPPDPGVPRHQAALFHAGGFLPYSDRIFRFLPESNLFRPWLDRGIAVYAMELKGDGDELRSIGSCTLERHIDVLSELSAIALRHNGGQRMMLEGYCGLAMPALAYLAARPEEADARFEVAFTMVAPIDGSKCAILNDMISTIPLRLIMAQTVVSELSGGYISGDNIRAGMDIPLNSFFFKTRFGRFVSGWKSGAYGEVRHEEDLEPGQRRELAGGYWISPENAQRYPMPVDMVGFASRLWTERIVDDHVIPYVYRGQRLSLRSIRDRTAIRLAGFYGGKDAIVPDETAHPLRKTLGDRYTHVVHPKAGHISYVLSPEVWDRRHQFALDPNPIDLVLSLYDRRDGEEASPVESKTSATISRNEQQASDEASRAKPHPRSERSSARKDPRRRSN